MSSLSETVANKSGISIKAGQQIGGMGVANKVPHLHLGLLQNRSQSSPSDWLSNVQVKNVLSSPSHWRGGYTKGYRHQAWLGERGKEFVMDADSTAAMDNVFPNMLKQLNRGNYAQTVALLRSWPQYASQAGQEVDLSERDKELIIAQGPAQIVRVPVSAGGGRGGDPMASLVMTG